MIVVGFKVFVGFKSMMKIKMVCMFVYLPNPYVSILTPNVMVLGDRTFGR